MSLIRSGIAETKHKIEKTFPSKGGSIKGKTLISDPNKSVYPGYPGGWLIPNREEAVSNSGESIPSFIYPQLSSCGMVTR